MTGRAQRLPWWLGWEGIKTTKTKYVSPVGLERATLHNSKFIYCIQHDRPSAQPKFINICPKDNIKNEAQFVGCQFNLLLPLPLLHDLREVSPRHREKKE